MKLTRTNEQIFDAYLDGKRYIILQGGARSGKTYAILQFLILLAVKTTKPLLISVVSATMPHLKRGAMRDFLNILTGEGIQAAAKFNKTDKFFEFGNSVIEFFSADQPGKVFGPGRDILFINETPNLSAEIARALILRTRKAVIMDYNPVRQHWVADYEQEPNAYKFVTTYKDNPYLPVEQVAEIERLKRVDEVSWKIFGLGEFSQPKEQIYNWEVVDEDPEANYYIYGVDFGFNNPTAVVKIAVTNDGYCVVDELYATGLTTEDLITELPEIIDNKDSVLFCDSAEPDRIAQLRAKGYNARPADKEVLAGINYIKQQQITIHRRCVHTINEMTLYSWATKDDAVLDYPIKANDHAMDAVRYAIYTSRSHTAKNQLIIPVKPVKRTYK